MISPPIAQWSETSTALALGLASGLGTVVSGIWFYVGNQAQKQEGLRRDILIKEYDSRITQAESMHKECEQRSREQQAYWGDRCKELEERIRAIEKEFRAALWEARQGINPGGSGPSATPKGMS